VIKYFCQISYFFFGKYWKKCKKEDGKNWKCI